MSKPIQIFPMTRIPMIRKKDNLGKIICEHCRQAKIILEDDDVIVIAQKIISKAEGSVVDLNKIKPSPKAEEIAQLTGRDARLCQVYRDESSEIIAVKGRMVIARHRLGFVCSSAGVDRSNVASHEAGIVSLLPKDPDKSARKIRKFVKNETGVTVAVVINDSFGREGRDGSVGIAIGIAGISHIESHKQKDLYENESTPRIALVDELAASASMVMGQAGESIPAAIIRGIPFTRDEKASIRKLLV